MKVNFKNMISGYTGRADDVIFVYDRQTNRYYVRSYPVWVEQPFNVKFRDVMRNLRKIAPSKAYKEDMQMYLALYNGLAVNRYNPVKAWNNLFMKVMYAIAKQYPNINLATLSREEIYERDLPCISVVKAVNAGLLPCVTGWQSLTREI